MNGLAEFEFRQAGFGQSKDAYTGLEMRIWKLVHRECGIMDKLLKVQLSLQAVLSQEGRSCDMWRTKKQATFEMMYQTHRLKQMVICS